ncbi:MAG TPA: ABC transporter ATP-binding protein [Anaerolineales bacterium]|nr:ABC transporter ATP-binding protein [Anaerolineales bacterium]
MLRGFHHQLNSSPLKPGDLQLKVEELQLSFGGVTALFNVSLDVYQSEILAIIGPNGAGKTSLLNCISGLYNPQKGSVLYYHQGEHEITRLRPHQIARLGIARSFQNIELFRHMSVLDNLLAGCHIHMRKDLFSSMFYWGPAQREQIEFRRYVEDIIDLLEIEAIRKQTVGALSYGLQKRVEMGRALAMRPAILLLDEPMAGMNAEEKEDMARFVLDINEEHGVTIVLIEHDMGVVMDISDRVAVLNFGQKIGEGSPDEVRQNPVVIQAYLGEDQSVFPFKISTGNNST